MLVEAGVPQDHPSLQKAGRYLMARQTNAVGDWIISSPSAEPGGWYFQFENELYPDVDDSAVVIMALSKLKIPEQEGELDESMDALGKRRGRGPGTAHPV